MKSCDSLFEVGNVQGVTVFKYNLPVPVLAEPQPGEPDNDSGHRSQRQSGEARESTENCDRMGEGSSMADSRGRQNLYPNTPGYKRHGTSQLAAESITPESKTLRDQCLEILRKYPATPDEIASKLGKSVLSVRPRVSELLALGQIKETEMRRRNASGKLATVLTSLALSGK